MPTTYAKIQSGSVVNIQVCQSTDFMDPSFTWVEIDGLICNDGSPIQIGCTYDGTNFYPSG
jgi:hypothetical protein